MRIGKNNSHLRQKIKGVVTGTFLEVDIEADASSGKTVKAPFPLTVVGMKVICTAANASGTVTLSDGTNAISDAVDAAVLDAVDNAVTLDMTYADISKGGDLVVTTNGAADRAKVLIEVLPR